MGDSVQVYSREFRLDAVRRILAGEKVQSLSEELGVHRKLLYEWARKVRQGGEANLRERGRPRSSTKAPSTAHREVDGIIEFFRMSLQASGLAATREWRLGVYRTIETLVSRETMISVEAMCDLAGVSRSGYYRQTQRRPPSP